MILYLVKSKKIKGIGYTMEHHWKRDLSLHIKEIRILEIFNLAFMDDTTWIASGKRGLTDQLIIAKNLIDTTVQKLIQTNRN